MYIDRALNTTWHLALLKSRKKTLLINRPGIDADKNYYSQVKPRSSCYISEARPVHSDQAFKLLHINCRSLINKVSDIKVLVAMVQPILVA